MIMENDYVFYLNVKRKSLEELIKITTDKQMKENYQKQLDLVEENLKKINS